VTSGTATTPLPHGTTLTADPTLRRRDQGRLLIGGSPLRFVRLTDAGASTVTRWLRGEPVGGTAGSTSLARRLVSAGMAHPVPPDDAVVTLDDVTVVIPVKDDPVGLAATLASLPPGVSVVVVDDGSEPPVDRNAVEPAGLLVRRSFAGGPGVARQAAMPHADSALIAFVDAGVELEPTSLERLARWFADPTVVAVGPRVASRVGPGRLARYEERRSPLDLGATPAPVDEQSPVTYLPTACLLARRCSVEAAGGFDATLRWGEDVDLVWRLSTRGDVRFDPSVVVEHPPRPTMSGFVRQRFGYGSAAGPLAARHPGRLAPIRMSGWSVACWALAALGRPGAGLALAAATAAALHRKLTGTIDDSAVESVLLSGRGHLLAGRALVRAGTRVWWPVTVVLWLAGARRLAGRVVALSLLDRWLSADGGPAKRAIDAGLGIVDDAAYGAGVWRGALAARSAGPLLPDLIQWPPRDDG